MKVKFKMAFEDEEFYYMIWEDGKYRGDTDKIERAVDCTLEHAVEVVASVSIVPYDLYGFPVHCIDIIAPTPEETQRIKDMYAEACKMANKQKEVCKKMGCVQINMMSCCLVGKWGKCKKLKEKHN